MKRTRAPSAKIVTVSPAVAKKVAAAAKRVGLTREQALAIARAEPRGATIFAGSLVPMSPVRDAPAKKSTSGSDDSDLGGTRRRNRCRRR